MKSKKKSIIITTSIAVLLVFTIVLNTLALTKFDNIFEKYFGKSEATTTGDTLGADVNYVKSDFNSPSELYAYEESKVAEIAQEGIVLLENNGILPLEKGTTLSIFSHSSVDLVSGGSGSGSGSFELTKNLKEGLTNAGLLVNEKLWNFYESGDGSKYKRGPGVINYGADLNWAINECPLNVITKDSQLVESFDNTVAMFVLSRTGGEGGDEARDMAAFGGVSGQHYLEPDKTELEIIEYLNDNFDNVILLVNCNNAMELGWVKDYENITAVVNFPGAGRVGTYGLGYMLTGIDEKGNAFSPSGHLVDTFVYDNFSSPAMQNMGDFVFENSHYYYVNYAEGIYVGYKYYETRYEDIVTGRANAGRYNYANTVTYPFGYGLSYTDFEWSDFTMSQADKDGKITVTLNVKNTGDRAGKDVVQVYVQAPYFENGVEKASVNLVGFAKTSLLAAGASEKVEVVIDVKNFTSYDVNANGGKGGYILDAGKYYVTAASNAHEAINQILVARSQDGDTTVNTELLVDAATDDSQIAAGTVMVGVHHQEKYDSTTYSVAGEGLANIENQFDDADLEDANYLSRSNWKMMEQNGLRYGYGSSVASRAEVGGKQFYHPLSEEMRKRLESFNSLNPTVGTDNKNYVFAENNDVELIDLRGLSYDDPLWEALLNRITLKELSKLIDESGYCSPAMLSIHKPKVTDLDGPAGLNDIIAHGSMPIGDGLRAMTWPTQYILACSWNVDLAEDMGRGVAEDGLYSGTVGWYGPGMNIHRTPFSGRNFEYYSEDPFISGVLGRATVNGAAQKGMYAFIKHFALNDQETHRDEYGIATFSQEQAIRELYMKPFEMTILDNTVEINYNKAIKDANGNITGYEMATTTVPAATAIMTSFNRIGATWAGGHYGLITEVLREEWGFKGFVLTDYEVGGGKGAYMETLQCLAAGGDAKLKTVGMDALFGFDLSKHPEYQGYGKEAAHHILYTVVNSAGMNGYVHGVQYVEGFAYYKLILIAWDVVAAGLIIWLCILLFKKKKVAVEA
ncbi:MAG: beta-glucosidase [Lachnospiraceae bacterium]|nr:beta-glucosidase [Lachnospiraceae bacterium]